MWKNHSITSLDSAKPQTTTVSCSIHTTELVKYYCCQCACLICNECIIKHKDHELMLIDEAAESEVVKLKFLFPKFKQSIEPIGKAIEEVSTAIESITNKQQVLVSSVEEAFQKIIAGVEKRRDEVIGEISGLLIAKQTRLQMQKEEFEKIFSGLKLAVDTTSIVCDDYSPPEVLAVSKTVQNASDNAMKSFKLSSKGAIDDTCPEFRYDLSQVDKAILSFGKLAYFSTFPSLCSLVDVNPNMSIGVGCGNKSCLTLQTRNSKGEDLRRGGGDIKATIKGSSVVLECEIEDCGTGQYNIIFSISTPGPFKLHVGVDGTEIGDSPYSVNSIDYDDVLSSDSQAIDSTYSPQYPAWGEVTGCLYITTNEGHVLVYNKDMSLKKLISKDKLGCKHLRGILVDEREGVMLLANSSSHSIVKADLDGNVLTSVGERGNNQLEFNFPTGLGKTKEGLILVGDCQNKEVQILNPDLSYNDYFKCHAQVWGVSVDRNNLIHVGTKKGVEVFKKHNFFVNAFSRIAEYGNGLDKAGGIHFPNYQHSSSAICMVTDCYSNSGEIALYNWKENESIASWYIGDFPLGIAINQEGVVCVCCYGDNEFQIYS